MLHDPCIFSYTLYGKNHNLKSGTAVVIVMLSSNLISLLAFSKLKNESNIKKK